jgi:hypothetical protein
MAMLQDGSELLYVATAEQIAAAKAGTNELYVGMTLVINTPITVNDWDLADLTVV